MREMRNFMILNCTCVLVPSAMNKCVFLDRDGVINEERGDYTYRLEDFKLISGVTEAIKLIKELGYLAIVITNQAGITKGVYTREQMNACHEYMMEATGHLIDAIYYSPYHPAFSNSISRKPDTLMIEKAMARFNIDPTTSWFAGDRERDMECGNAMDLKIIKIQHDAAEETIAPNRANNLLEAVNIFIRPEAGLMT